MRLKVLLRGIILALGLIFLSKSEVFAQCTGGCQIYEDICFNPEGEPYACYFDGCNGCHQTGCGAGEYKCNSGCCGCEISGCPEEEAGCFSAGTGITMADGTRKNIEEVDVGERVLSRGESGETTVSTVRELLRPVSDHLCTIKFSGGQELETTRSHPFLTDNGWRAINAEAALTENPGVPVTDLVIGDEIYREDGGTAAVTDIACWSGRTQVYNFKVDNAHTYFAAGFAAHNKGSGCFAPQNVNCPLNSACTPSGGNFCNTYNVNYNSVTETYPTEPGANEHCQLGNAQTREQWNNGFFVGDLIRTYACCAPGAVSRWDTLLGQAA